MSPRILTTVTRATASAYDLATLPAVKDELGITDGAQDGILGRYITSASAAAAQYCNRQFPVETIVDEVWAQTDPLPTVILGRIRPLQLSKSPVVTVTSVVENGTTLVNLTDYRVHFVLGQIDRLNGSNYQRDWPSWPIVVSYTAGYATIPSDVADAVTRMVVARFRGKGRDPYMTQENVQGVYQWTRWVPTGADAGNMTPDVLDILNNYRIPVIA